MDEQAALGVGMKEKAAFVAAGGHNRDWVFVTSSLLEERIEKIKRFAVNRLGERGAGRLAFRLMSPVLILAIMGGMIFSIQRRASLINRTLVGQGLEDAYKLASSRILLTQSFLSRSKETR